MNQRQQYAEFDLTRYSHRQIWRLLRDLTVFGWTVTLRTAPDGKSDGRDRADNILLSPLVRDAEESWNWCCQVDHADGGGSRVGRTAWEALRSAVNDIVSAVERGDDVLSKEANA